MPYFIPKPRLREVRNPKFRNACWENWGIKEGIIGSLLSLLGILLSIAEIVRIIYGVTNKGISNYIGNQNPLFTVKDDSNLFPINTAKFPTRVEKFHYWPWSYAANLFGLVAICAGIAGLISAYRRSYSSVFTFMTLSLLTCLLSAYLVGYYSVLISYYVSSGLSDSANRPATMDTTWGLIGVGLAISCGLVLLGALGFIVGFLGIRGCQAKGLHIEDTKVPYIEPIGAKGRIVPTKYLT